MMALLSWRVEIMPLNIKPVPNSLNCVRLYRSEAELFLAGLIRFKWEVSEREEG
jgi:hypothetical protein